MLICVTFITADNDNFDAPILIPAPALCLLRELEYRSLIELLQSRLAVDNLDSLMFFDNDILP
jgi:hypothetical protein